MSSAYWMGFDGLVQISDANIEKPSNDVISYDCFFVKQSQFDTIIDIGTTYLVKQIRHTIP
jgi:hypothetical protein